jgi:hypothetical protein
MFSEYILASNRPSATVRAGTRSASIFRYARFLLVDSRTDMLAVGPLLPVLTLSPLEQRRAGN